MERLSIADAYDRLIDLARMVPPEYENAIDVALAVMDYSIGGRVDCDTCSATGEIHEAIACPVCDGFGHADPEVVKATYGEWPTLRDVVLEAMKYEMGQEAE